MRKEIVTLLSQTPTQTGLIDELLSCIETTGNKESIEQWLRGFVYSLFYKPNNIMLVLKGEKGIGMGYFLKYLMPVDEWATDNMIWPRQIDSVVYNKMVAMIRLEFRADIKVMNKAVLSDYFKVSDELPPEVDKRLASFCSIVYDNILPKEGKFILQLEVLSVDIEKFKQINKLELWREIFAKYYPMKERLPLSQESISKLFDNPYQKAVTKLYEQQRQDNTR